MSGLFHHPLQDEEWIGILVLVIIVGLLGMQTLKAVLAHVRQSREHDAAVTLKLEMIQHGMSADEIERVLAARSDGSYQHPSLPKRVGRAAGQFMRQAFDRG